MRLRIAPKAKAFPSDCGPLPQGRPGIQWARGWVCLRQLGWPGFISGHVRTRSSSTAPEGHQDLGLLWASARCGLYFPEQGLCFPGSQILRESNDSSHSHALPRKKCTYTHNYRGLQRPWSLQAVKNPCSRKSFPMKARQRQGGAPVMLSEDQRRAVQQLKAVY